MRHLHFKGFTLVELLVVIAIIGILIGLLVSRFIFKDKPIGSLRVDQSDPYSEPYLFLELDPGGMNYIYKKHSVRLRVKIKNSISHK